MATGDKRPVVMGQDRAVPGGVATLDSSGILTASQRPNLAQVGGSNPNLLHNWDFRNPVNRNGQTEYTEAGESYTIDRWFKQKNITVSINENGISLIPNNVSTLNTNFGQKVSRKELVENQKYTFSVLTSNNLISLTFVFAQNMMTDIYEYFGENQYLRIHYYSDLKTIACSIFNRTGLGGSELLLKAAKLELGPVQTLARQNEDGEWEIIDPPDYDLQYLLCSQYSPITGEWVGSQHSNPNLLDNAYWANEDAIINQRGKTEYTAAGYTIDRWMFLSSAIGTLTILSDKIRILAPSNNICIWIQKGDVKYPKGTRLTVSALIANNEAAGSLTLRGIELNNETVYAVIGINGPGLYTAYAELPKDTKLIVQFAAYKNSSLEIKAAKLELGPVQTLAHKEGDTWVLNDPPPDPALELLKCQRYYRVYATSSARPSKALDCCPVMRIDPAQTTITIDGVTYYANDANL